MLKLHVTTKYLSSEERKSEKCVKKWEWGRWQEKKKKKEEEVDLVSTHRVAETIATSEMITRCQSMKGLFSQRLSH